MTRADMARVEGARRRLLALGCRLIEPNTVEGYYVRDARGSIVTNRGYPLSLSDVERWIEDEEAGRHAD